MHCGLGTNSHPETRDPPGGTAGRVKPYGRWGGWALAPEYGLDGEELSLPPIRSRQGHWAFNPLAIFFGLFERRLWAAGLLACHEHRLPIGKQSSQDWYCRVVLRCRQGEADDLLALQFLRQSCNAIFC